ncbi:MAG: alkaline phosphatase family protein [Bdellovibrio sp.]|nr:alkaline phosphatase family protein [Bdellovibrio sp.]
MMRLKISVQKIVLIFFLLASCSTPVSEQTLRRPANDPKNLPFIRNKDFVDAKLYHFKGPLAFPPVRWIVEIVIKKKAKEFLKELPLDKTVYERIMDKLKDHKFMVQFIPFLLAIKDMYMAREKDKKRNFENHIKKYWPDPNALPGLKHSLFTYESKTKKKIDDKDKSGSSPGMSKKMIAKFVTLVDAIMFKEIDFRLGMKPVLAEERIVATMPAVKALMEQVVEEFEIPETYKEIVTGIINEPRRLETLTVSLSEVILKTIYNNYQMFARQYHREEILKDWLLREVEKKDSNEVWEYLRESMNERRYAVHIVVDGLQGGLTEALVNLNPADPFLPSIYQEHQNRDSYKPKNIPFKETDKQQMDFLKYIVEGTERFEHPQYLPFFKELYLKYKNGIAMNGISTTPTISVRNIPMATTGAAADGPGGTLLPNFHYVDRKKDRAYYFFGNDALRIEDLANENGLKTIFQRLTYLNTLNCNNQFGLGSDMLFDPLINIAVGESSRDFGEIICLADLERRMEHEKRANEIRTRLLGYEKQVKQWHRMARAFRDDARRSPMLTVRALVRELAEHENAGMPAYLALYVAWPDHFAHFKGPFSDEIISPTGEYNRLDYWLGRVRDVYKNSGIFDKTIWGLAGDHGLTPVYYLLNPEVVVFDKMKHEGIDLLVRKISSDEGEGPKLNHPFKPNSVKGVDVVIASTAGGNYMIDFFIDQAENWSKQPLYEDIRHLKLMSGQVVDMISELATRLEDTLDYFVVRENKCTMQSCDVKVGRMEGDKLVEASIYRRGDRIFYSYGDVDLMDVGKLNHYRKVKDEYVYHELAEKCLRRADINNIGTWCFEDEWRLLTSYTERPDSVAQLAHLYDSDLAGTVNLFPRPGIGYNSKVPGRHAGEYYHEKDALVAVWGTNVNPPMRLRSEQNGSMPVVLYEYLSGKKTYRGQDGWGFDSFIEKLNINFK